MDWGAIGEQLASGLLGGIWAALMAALAAVPPFWQGAVLFGGLGLLVGFMWGRFNLPGLVAALVGAAYLLGRVWPVLKAKPDPPPAPGKPKKTLKDLFK